MAVAMSMGMLLNAVMTAVFMIRVIMSVIVILVLLIHAAGAVRKGCEVHAKEARTKKAVT